MTLASEEDWAAAISQVRHEEREESRPRAKPFPLVRVCDVDEIDEQSWLIEGLIPRFDDGTAGYIFGPAKARKSLLLCDLALSVATGTPALGRFEVGREGAVAGFFAEDPRAEVARRIGRLARARGLSVPTNITLVDVPTLALDSQTHQDRLLATLTGIPNLAMVWLDPMVRLHSVNDNRAEELAPIHTYLRALARELPGAVVVLAHHTSRAGGSRGSSDYDAFGDFNVYLAKKDDHTTHVVKIENRGGPPCEPFSFTVRDDSTEEGPALSLVVSGEGAIAKSSKAQERDRNALATIRQIRLSNPDTSGKQAQGQLRALNIKMSNTKFWELWNEEL